MSEPGHEQTMAAAAAAAAAADPTTVGPVRGPIPRQGRLLGVDYGRRRIGLAICDPQRRIASPVATIPNNPAMITRFRQLVTENAVVGIVVGLPLHAHGEESEMSAEARRFATWLAAEVHLPVVMWDERYTSAAAESVLLDTHLTQRQRKARVDRVAAQMLLQTYIEAGAPAHGSE
ncbi:MAG: Holliday junction resolvase RuvX [Gemmataceae bacterium]|nr:Holliday junction resolvase RuvX [Gemmata sp.]MDW8197482.1 Holliday junction resolvase RuvX [Gemmataceae bacterium]